MDRNIKTEKEELDEMKKVYEGIVGVATTGLFFRTGLILGKKIAEIGNKERERYFEIAKNILIENGWVSDVVFDNERVVVIKSIEIGNFKSPGCHMLRGVISKLYEEYYHTKINCNETECESIGNKQCVFIIER